MYSVTLQSILGLDSWLVGAQEMEKWVEWAIFRSAFPFNALRTQTQNVKKTMLVDRSREKSRERHGGRLVLWGKEGASG